MKLLQDDGITSRAKTVQNTLIHSKPGGNDEALTAVSAVDEVGAHRCTSDFEASEITVPDTCTCRPSGSANQLDSSSQSTHLPLPLRHLRHPPEHCRGSRNSLV
jgi:hypothetical protein